VHPLLASGRGSDVCARGAAPPGAHDEQDDAQDGEDDPYHEQDVADFVNVEPAGRDSYRESQDGTDDYEHNGEPQEPATCSSAVHSHERCPVAPSRNIRSLTPLRAARAGTRG